MKEEGIFIALPRVSQWTSVPCFNVRSVGKAADCEVFVHELYEGRELLRPNAVRRKITQTSSSRKLLRVNEPGSSHLD